MLFVIFIFLAALLLGWIAVRGLVFSLVYLGQWIRYRRPNVFPRPTVCPRCEVPGSRFQRPKSLKELVLGGWTCPNCGSEFDQLDNIRIARAWNASLADLETRARREALAQSSEDPRTPVERLFDE